jgi:hypothetical protein
VLVLVQVVAGSVMVHKVVAPDFTVTVPVGVPVNSGATLAVKVFDCSFPYVTAGEDRERDVDVLALLTVNEALAGVAVRPVADAFRV